MRCKACGRVIDSNMRFCTFCDHDNYPEMNTVRLKGDKTTTRYSSAKNNAYSKQSTPNSRNSNTTNQKTSANNVRSNGNNSKTGNQNTGCLVVAVIIFILFIIFSAILGE